jgi:cytochrome d ubiquinol oxidase subunit II
VLASFGRAHSIFPDIVTGRMTGWEAASSTASLNAIFLSVTITLPVIVAYTVFMYRVFWGKATELTVG